jgi:hypothetical protein
MNTISSTTDEVLDRGSDDFKFMFESMNPADAFAIEEELRDLARDAYGAYAYFRARRLMTDDAMAHASASMAKTRIK